MPHKVPGNNHAIQEVIKMKILVVDDDYATINLIRNILDREHQTMTVRKAREGLDLLKGGRFDLVILDWMMPGLDGLTMLKNIKSDKAICMIPVIFLSSKVSDEDIKRAMDEGAAGYITKPFTRQTIIKEINRVRNIKIGQSIPAP